MTDPTEREMLAQINKVAPTYTADDATAYELPGFGRPQRAPQLHTHIWASTRIAIRLGRWWKGCIWQWRKLGA
jgi:hypothetical protein